MSLAAAKSARNLPTVGMQSPATLRAMVRNADQFLRENLVESWLWIHPGYHRPDLFPIDGAPTPIVGIDYSFKHPNGRRGLVIVAPDKSSLHDLYSSAKGSYIKQQDTALFWYCDARRELQADEDGSVLNVRKNKNKKHSCELSKVLELVKFSVPKKAVDGKTKAGELLSAVRGKDSGTFRGASWSACGDWISTPWVVAAAWGLLKLAAHVDGTCKPLARAIASLDGTSNPGPKTTRKQAARVVESALQGSGIAADDKQVNKLADRLGLATPRAESSRRNVTRAPFEHILLG